MDVGPSVGYPISSFGVARIVIRVPNQTINNGRMFGIAQHTQLAMNNPMRELGPSVLEAIPIGGHESWQQLLRTQKLI